MGKASRKKAEQRAFVRERPQLLTKVRDQYELLKILGKTFDAGHAVVAYPIATTIRVLVHNTVSSHALLAQLNVLDKWSFHDTSLPLDPRNLLSHAGLVIMQMTAGSGTIWVPRKEVTPPVPGAEPRSVSFGGWWKTHLTKDFAGRTWSRQGMVLAIANKEGGAHVDPEQPLDVKAIEQENSMGWSHYDPIVGDQPMVNGPLLPSIRQIGYELEVTLRTTVGQELGLEHVEGPS